MSQEPVKAPVPPAAAAPAAGDGIRSMQTSGIFRTFNFELYAKPNKYMMAFGVIAFSGCIGYLSWMKATHKKNNLYTALDENEDLVLREKKSRWS